MYVCIAIMSIWLILMNIFLKKNKKSHSEEWDFGMK